MSMKTDDEYFEFLLKKASDAYCDEQGEKYIKELESSEKAKVSKNFKRRTKKTIIGKYNKRHSALYKAAVIILMFCAVGTVTVYNADANKLKFITQLFKSDDKSIDISTKENILDYDIDELPDGWDYIYLPQYVPAGYKVDEIEVYSNSVDIVYYCGDNYVLFSQCKEINTNESVDNERHSIEKIKIDNYEAYLFLGENDSILSWNNENYSFTISGNLNNEEIIAFAESLEKY